MFEDGARYLAGPEHHCKVRGGLEGDQELLQKELNLMRRHSRYHWSGFGVRIERDMERGAFALVDEEEALAKANRDPSSSLMSLVERKERTKVAANSTTKQISLAADSHFIHKQHIQASRVVIALSFNPNMPRALHVALNLRPQRGIFGTPNR